MDGSSNLIIRILDDRSINLLYIVHKLLAFMEYYGCVYGGQEKRTLEKETTAITAVF